ncbi:MAG: TonB-dependent receptor [Bacteroidota bacterium]
MRIAWSLALLMLLAAGPAWAQSGKIAGTVTDALTGERLPGVNVLIEGTTQGTATNIDGEYVIIGVRPGTYTIVASYIGFANARKPDVLVSVDLTATVDFELREEVFEGEEIVVTAEVPVVRKDLTSSEARVTAETIEKLPVTELGQLLEVQAGITTRGGAIHVRGGRSSEVVYMVDGVPVSDSYDGSAAVQLENDGIQELQVISGTFNAEYGNAMSGVINIVSKEGRSDRFGGSAEFFAGSYAVSGSGGEEALLGIDADEFTSAGVPYRDIDPYSYLPVNATHFTNGSVSIEGPIIGNKLTIFALGRYFRNEGWLYGANIYNQDGTFGDSTLVPMNSFEKGSWQANLRYQLNNNIILNLSTLGSQSVGDSYGGGVRWVPSSQPTNYDGGFDVRLKMTHLLSAKTFYTLNVGTFFRRAESYVFEDPFDDRYNDFFLNQPDSVEVQPGVFQEVPAGGFFYARGGTSLGQFERTTRSYLIKGDLSTQLGRNHLIKTGFQAKVDNLFFEAYQLQAEIDPVSGNPVTPFQTAIPDRNSSRFNSFEDVSPITINAYIQDKMEFENFIVNAGLRLDYFDARAEVPADSSDPNIFNPLKLTNRFFDTNGDGIITDDEERDDNRLSIEDREAYWWREVDPKIQLSPRLGVAYPITEQGVIHFSYGLFFQIPTLNNLFDNFGYKVPALSGNYGPFGNPDLDAQKTTMYEIGFKQGFGDYLLDLTAYYRDVRDWVSTSVPIRTALPGINYVVFTNRDYANTRGVTLTFSKKYTGNFGFDFNYTFQVVEGSNSNPADEFFSLLGNGQPTLALLPLNWDQRHRIAGAVYTGGSDWGGSLRFRAGTGFPYTPSFPQAALVGSDVVPEFPSNSRRLPQTAEFDINVYKEFDLGAVRPRVFVDILNLLDTRNVQGVYGDSGRPDVTINQRQSAADPGFFVRPEFYSEPRRIQLGVQVRF